MKVQDVDAQFVKPNGAATNKVCPATDIDEGQVNAAVNPTSGDEISKNPMMNSHADKSGISASTVPQEPASTIVEQAQQEAPVKLPDVVQLESATKKTFAKTASLGFNTRSTMAGSQQTVIPPATGAMAPG